MQAWTEYLDELREAGKVIPLRRESREAAAKGSWAAG